MALTDERPVYLDDVVIWEADNARDAAVFKNTSGATADFAIGSTLVVSGNYVVPATSTTADYVLLTALTDVANNGEAAVAVIGGRGNCTLNGDAITTGEVGTEADLADQLTALAAQGCKIVYEATVSSNG